MATLVRWEPFRELAALQNDMGRLMSTFLGQDQVGGERERTHGTEGDRFYRYERRFGSFARTVGLPQGVSEDGIKADYRNGVLEIHVGKPESPKPRRIQIGSGEQATIEGASKKK